MKIGFVAAAAVAVLLREARAGVVTWKGVADTQAAGINNTLSLNSALSSLQAGETLLIKNKTYWVAGGVRGINLHSVILQLDGTLKFLPGRTGWPTQAPEFCDLIPLQPKRNKTCVQEAMFFANATNLTLTSSNAGTLDGSGASWWGYIQYLVHGENRPRLLSLINATDVVVERWQFQQSPYWTFTAFDVAQLTIRHCAIDNRVNAEDGHGPLNLAAFNTDGFDVAGKNIHIHDCRVWNQDDCFTIQPMDSTNGYNAQCTENVLVENVNASGLGLTVGAVHPTKGHNCIRNVTFRNAHMHHTFKGIYMKGGQSQDPSASGEITNVLYENVVMAKPEQVPIWIGPAQEADSKDACSLLWPVDPKSPCPPPPSTLTWSNITLRDIRIESPLESPGVVLGNPSNAMRGVVFDNVVVTPVDPSKRPWKKEFYFCQGVNNAISTGGTSPAPPCFNVTHSTRP